MGMFTSVLKESKCERCKVRMLFEYQIKTGFDSCERYTHGQSLKGEGVPYGLYEASRKRLCNDCEVFSSEWKSWIERTWTPMLLREDKKLSFVQRQGYRFLLLGRKVIADVGYGLTVRNPRSKVMRSILAMTREFWKRQIAVAHLGRWIYIEENECAADRGGVKRRQIILRWKSTVSECRVKIDARAWVVRTDR